VGFIIELAILFSSVPGWQGFCGKKSFGIIFLIFFLAISGELFAQTITVGPDTTICFGGSVTLNAVVVSGGYGTSSYTFLAIPYTPMPFSGGVPLDTSFDHPNHCTASGHDDCWGGPFNIGFSFCFLNVDYTQFWIGSNGWISFSQPNNQWDNYTPDTLPNSSGKTPKNCIMSAWQDWSPGAGGVGNNIYYYSTGTEPDRKCVIYWLNCPMYYCTSKLGTFQIVLHEQTSIIENNIQVKDSCSWQQNRGTQGIQNMTGTVAFIPPGRNNQSWKVFNESTRFVPGGISWYIGGYPNGTQVGYGPSITVSPNNTIVYTGVVEVCGGTFSSENDTVSVMDPRFNYPGSSFCLNESDLIPSLDMTAGIFTSSPPGLVFVNDTTGEIDLSASLPGNYLITHTITRPCTVAFSKSVILYAPPDAPNPVNSVVTRCGPGNVTMSVTADVHQGVRWYNSPNGGIQYPFTGLTVTPAITSTTIFYAEAFDSLTGCRSSLRSLITAIVEPVPSIINTVVKDTVCSGFNNYFLLQTDLPGVSFFWTASDPLGNITGFITPNSGDIISDTLTNHLFTSGNVIYIVHASLNGCGDTVNFTTHVNPRPNVIFQSSSDTICSGLTTNITLLSSVSGTIFSWTASGSSGSISGYGDGNGSVIAQTLSSIDYITETVDYDVSPYANACRGIASHAIVSIFPSPSVNLTTCWDTVVTTDAQPIKLKGGIPLGGTYSGVGVNTDIFYPGIAGQGIFSITYGFTNNLGCTKTSAKNIIVTSPVVFSCGNDLTDVRDNRIYSTVQIGTQCWMGSNLDFGTFIVSSQMQRDNCVSEKYCYGDISTNCLSTGGLYQWDEMMKFDNTTGAQGFCPSSWHVPTEADWTILFAFYNGNGFAGSSLKFSGHSGFNAFLSGIRYENVAWDFNNFAVFYWSSTSQDSNKAWAHGMNSVNPGVSFYPGLKDNAFYVRCIKD
jgi:uncharacterized protein (TIGR02145 family)